MNETGEVFDPSRFSYEEEKYTRRVSSYVLAAGRGCLFKIRRRLGSSPRPLPRNLDRCLRKGQYLQTHGHRLFPGVALPRDHQCLHQRPSISHPRQGSYGALPRSRVPQRALGGSACRRGENRERDRQPCNLGLGGNPSDATTPSRYSHRASRKEYPRDRPDHGSGPGNSPVAPSPCGSAPA